MEDFVVATLPENDPITIIMQTGYKFGYDTGFKAGVESVQHKVGVGENLISRTDAIQGAAEKIKTAPTVDAEPVRLRIDTVEVDAEKGWYRKMYYCPCGQLIKTETWDRKYCFGHGTVLKGNVMPEHCPNCGAKMDAEVSE